MAKGIAKKKQEVKEPELIRLGKETIQEPKKFVDLRVIQIQDFHLVPEKISKLLEPLGQIPDIGFIYQNSDKIFVNSPTERLYVFADKDTIIHGFMWFSLNFMERIIFIQACAVDEEYRGRHEVLPVLREWFEKYRDNMKFKKIAFGTHRPDIYEALGVSRSKLVLMELV